MALPQARDPGSPPCLGTHQHTPTDAGTPKHASTGPNPTVAARPVPGRRSGAVPCPQLTAGTVSSRRGWSRSRAPGSFPRGTAPAASRPPPARWGRGTSWAQRGHTGTPRATGHPPRLLGPVSNEGRPLRVGDTPQGHPVPWGTFRVMGALRGLGVRGATTPWGTQISRGAPSHAIEHPNILWGTQISSGAPKPVGIHPCHGAQPHHGTPVTPQGPARGVPSPAELCPHPRRVTVTLLPPPPGTPPDSRLLLQGQRGVHVPGAGGTARPGGGGGPGGARQLPGQAGGALGALKLHCGDKGVSPTPPCPGPLSVPQRNVPEVALPCSGVPLLGRERSGVTPMGVTGCWGARGDSHGHWGAWGAPQGAGGC